jgi:hypothetical protein
MTIEIVVANIGGPTDKLLQLDVFTGDKLEHTYYLNSKSNERITIWSGRTIKLYETDRPNG